MHPSEIPTDPVAFNALVQIEAQKLALQKSGQGVIPNGSDVKAVEPLVRAKLMAQRNQSVFDRIAGFVSRKAEKVQAETAMVESDIQAVLGLQRQYEDLVGEREVCTRRLLTADQQFAQLDIESKELKDRLPLYYTGEAGENSDLRLSAILTSYTRLSAIDSAKYDWPLVRERIQGQLEACENKIAAFEKQNAELFTAR